MPHLAIKIEWKKLPSDPKTHDQWEAVGVDALIRKINEYEYQLYFKQKYVGQFTSLSGAKRTADQL